jgi:hypothetical protein
VAVEMKVVWRASDGKLKCCDFSRSALVGLALVLSEQPAAVAHAPSTSPRRHLSCCSVSLHFQSNEKSSYYHHRFVTPGFLESSLAHLRAFLLACALSLLPQYSTTRTEYGPQ